MADAAEGMLLDLALGETVDEAVTMQGQVIRFATILSASELARRHRARSQVNAFESEARCTGAVRRAGTLRIRLFSSGARPRHYSRENATTRYCLWERADPAGSTIFVRLMVLPPDMVGQDSYVPWDSVAAELPALF